MIRSGDIMSTLEDTTIPVGEPSQINANDGPHSGKMQGHKWQR